MSALMSLSGEHQMISELLGAWETYGTRLQSGASVDPADLARFSEVFRELIDYRHHEKEESILLPLLARNGFEWSTGLLAELRREHVQLRYLIDVLCQAGARQLLGGREQRRQIGEGAAAFVELARAHMHKEETVLLPAIAQRLTPHALDRLGVELAQFDAVTGRHAANELVFRQAAELVTRYSEDSVTLDVRGLEWAGAGPAPDAPSAALCARREASLSPFTSWGRGR